MHMVKNLQTLKYIKFIFYQLNVQFNIFIKKRNNFTEIIITQLPSIKILCFRAPPN